MRGTKKSASKFAGDAEEALTPASLATLAARIAPALCRSEPKRAIEDAARLIECAREQLEREHERASLANERAQLEADARNAAINTASSRRGGTSRLKMPSSCRKKSVSGKENDRE